MERGSLLSLKICRLERWEVSQMSEARLQPRGPRGPAVSEKTQRSTQIDDECKNTSKPSNNSHKAGEGFFTSTQKPGKKQHDT